MQRFTLAAVAAAIATLVIGTGCSGGSRLAPNLPANDSTTAMQSVNSQAVPGTINLIRPDLRPFFAHLPAQPALKPAQLAQEHAKPAQVPCNSPQAPAKLYVTQSGASTVEFYNQANAFHLGTISVGLSNPAGINVRGDRVYVASYGNQLIQVYNKCGGGPVASLNDLPGFPTDVAFDHNGNLYATNLYDGTGNGEVRYYANAQGNGITIGDPLMANPFFVTVDGNGDVFVDGVSGSFIRVDWCHNTAINHCKNGNATWQPTNISLGYPGGMRIDGNNKLVVNDQFGAIRTFGIPGFNQIASNPCPTASQFTPIECIGIGFDATANKLFGADADNGIAFKANYPGFGGLQLFTTALSVGGQVISSAAWPAPPWGG